MLSRLYFYQNFDPLTAVLKADFPQVSILPTDASGEMKTLMPIRMATGCEGPSKAVIEIFSSDNRDRLEVSALTVQVQSEEAGKCSLCVVMLEWI